MMKMVPRIFGLVLRAPIVIIIFCHLGLKLCNCDLSLATEQFHMIVRQPPLKSRDAEKQGDQRANHLVRSAGAQEFKLESDVS